MQTFIFNVLAMPMINLQNFIHNMMLEAKEIQNAMQTCKSYGLLTDRLPTIIGTTPNTIAKKRKYDEEVPTEVEKIKWSQGQSSDHPQAAYKKPKWEKKGAMAPSSSSSSSSNILLIQQEKDFPPIKLHEGKEENDCGRCNRLVNTGKKHSFDDCPYRNHPDANNDPNTPWCKSVVGQGWAAAGYPCICGDKRLDPNTGKAVPFAYKPIFVPKKSTPRNTCELNIDNNIIYNTDIICITSSNTTLNENSLTNSISNNDYVYGMLSATEAGPKQRVTVLFDTGAFHGNYVSVIVANMLVKNSHGSLVIHKCSKIICGANENWCSNCIGTIIVNLKLKTEQNSNVAF